MRRARVDANQPEIVKVFRKMGCSVLHLHTVGKGCPDLLVGIQGKNLLVEIKDGSVKPSDRKLTKDEEKFHLQWSGQVCIIESRDDAINLISEIIFMNKETKDEIEQGKGELIDKDCPLCGVQLMATSEREWCPNVVCDYGIIDFTHD